MTIAEKFTSTGATSILTEMAMARADFIAELRHARPQITAHLLKLLAFEADEGLRTHWKAELTAFVEDISGIVLKGPKGKRRPPSPEDYTAVLFDAFFEDPSEVGNLSRLLSRIGRDYPKMQRNSDDDETIRLKLKAWYQKASPSMCGTTFDRAIIDTL